MTENVDEGVFDSLLVEANGTAARFVAAVVDVSPFVSLADQMRAATSAPDHTAEAEVVFVTGGQWPSCPEHGLGPVKQYLGNQRLMNAHEVLSGAFDVYQADIERIVQDARKGVDGDGTAAPTSETSPMHFGAELVEIVFPRGIKFESLPHHGALDRVDFFRFALPMLR